ncbi:MAG: OmpH family outer membrane protein [Paracoccaceae bacterium]|nr:OmpH family outer membrane protein [Paracoccaceae bacterium]
MGRAAAALLAGFWLIGAAASVSAQSAEALRSPVLIIDQDRLFAESQLGAAALRRIEDDARRLAAENRRIEAELLEEERALTERRASLTPEAFTAEANVFDEKVQRLRSEQDTKARALAQAREEARADFLGEIGGVLSEIALERGAVVMLDRRQVFLSVDAIDVTDEAIDRINVALGTAGPAQ